MQDNGNGTDEPSRPLHDRGSNGNYSTNGKDFFQPFSFKLLLCSYQAQLCPIVPLGPGESCHHVEVKTPRENAQQSQRRGW